MYCSLSLCRRTRQHKTNYHSVAFTNSAKKFVQDTLLFIMMTKSVNSYFISLVFKWSFVSLAFIKATQNEDHVRLFFKSKYTRR
jgi:hypothetical protein